jgi:ABC-type sugar transport system ATPase subunit
LNKTDKKLQQDQRISVKNLKIPSIKSRISFTIDTGDILGVLIEKKKKTKQVANLFKILTTENEDTQGNITIKGIDVTNKRKGISQVEWSYQPHSDEYFNRKIERDHKINNKRIKAVLKGMRKFCKKHKQKVENLQGRKLFLHTMLLDQYEKVKIRELTDSEYLRILIAMKILQNEADVILMEVPEELFGNLELQEFKNIIRDLGRIYKITFILVASREYLADCDHILNLTETKKRRTSTAARVESLLSTIPQMGEEILKFEINDGSAADIESLRAFTDAVIIETQENESFTIFPQKDIDKTITDIFRVIGTKVYNFKRVKPSLTEYLIFIEQN